MMTAGVTEVPGLTGGLGRSNPEVLQSGLRAFLIMVDMQDIGRQIIDAPLLDMRLEVIGTEEERRENGSRGRI